MYGPLYSPMTSFALTSLSWKSMSIKSQSYEHQHSLLLFQLCFTALVYLFKSIRYGCDPPLKTQGLSARRYKDFRQKIQNNTSSQLLIRWEKTRIKGLGSNIWWASDPPRHPDGFHSLSSDKCNFSTIPHAIAVAFKLYRGQGHC